MSSCPPSTTTSFRHAASTLYAGAAGCDITPRTPLFLYGYPHVPRTSTHIHDPLTASALYLSDGTRAALLISVDVLMLSHEAVRELREQIAAATGVPTGSILISATHTHSAPITAEILAFRDDPGVPPIDPAYLALVYRGICEAASAAKAGARPARLATATANVGGIGGNRHRMDGPTDPEVGILAVRDAADGALIAVDLIYSMHPTVLHEDSTAVSADFPGAARALLSRRFPGLRTIYHTGPSGDQSTRYYVQGQTFAEAERLGHALGSAVASAVEGLQEDDYRAALPIAVAQDFAALPGRSFPSVAEAEAMLRDAQATYARLGREEAPHGPLRTAEVAVFGAEERVTLARAQATGEIEALVARYTPVEVQVIRVGDTYIAGLPGELFVAYGLEVKARAPGRAFVISLANGELQGYITTPGATGYEDGISLFLPEAGDILVEAALRLMNEMAE